MRRELLLQDLAEVNAECDRLLRSGYVRHGNWTLGQICRHLKLTIDANVDGYPWWMTALGLPLRPILRRVMLPRLLRGRSPSGIKTAARFVPPAGLDDAAEVASFKECVDRYRTRRDRLHPHPGFGGLTPETFDRFHAAHAAHHLSFLDVKPS
ncbi:DUF1569 domain-containing protein [Alienimonas sp. DA493]|uniref:DUF1569 domain-containing protein n=1 Tax=Alienimonas sp. DA493 TaxID=3373605 RepID=UPI003754351D